MKRKGFLLPFCLAVLPLLGMAQVNPADQGKPFATVWQIRGEVLAGTPGATPRRLAEGMTVQVGEEIGASASGEAVLKTNDGGLIAVRPNTRFLAESYAADGKPEDRQVLRLISGALRVVTGWIGKLNRNGHRVNTPTATIGVRGTDHEPYVLPAELATEAYRSGTYDRVLRGGTLLEASGGNVEIDPGKVGFVRDPSPIRTRALMTLLMPVLLDKVPEFYVAGSFEKEIDRFSQVADRESLRALARKNPGARVPEPGSSARPAVASTGADRTPSAPVAARALPLGCQPREIAAYWLDRFDSAIQRKELKQVLEMLAPEIVATAHVRSGNEIMVLEFDRDEMVKSTIASISSIKDYQYRRTTLDAVLAPGETEASCQRLKVRSVAVEQGLMNGKPYRVEAEEEYLLERRGQEWLAVKAETRQK